MSRSDPTYCHNRSRGTAYVTLGGKQIQLGAYDSLESRQRYKQELERWKAMKRPRYARPGIQRQVTVEQLLAAFWEHAAAKWAHCLPAVEGNHPYSELGSYFDLMHQLRRLFGNMPAEQFGSVEVDALRDVLARPHEIEDRKTGQIHMSRAWCRSHINAQMNRLRSIWQFAKRQKLISKAAYAEMLEVDAIPEGTTGIHESMEVDEADAASVEAVLEHVSRHVNAMIRLQVITAMRPGEVCAMTMDQIDFRSDVWIYSPVQHKTAHRGTRRRIHLGKQAQELLTPFLRCDAKAPIGWFASERATPIFSPAEAEQERREALHKSRKTPVQPSQLKRAEKAAANKASRKRPPADRYSTQSYNKAIARACVQAGVGHFHAHQLRHLGACLIMEKVDADAAGILLGHLTKKMTERYTRRARTRRGESLAREIG